MKTIAHRVRRGGGAAAVACCVWACASQPPPPPASLPPTTPTASAAPSEAEPPAAASAAPPGLVASSPTAAAAPAASNEPASPPPALVAAVFSADTSSIERLYGDTSRAPQATLQAKGVLSDDPLAKGVRDLAKKAAPGMDPIGPLALGSLKERQVLQTDITLEPGKCYAIVGYSKRMRDVDLYLLLSPGILSAQDITDDNQPVIGGAVQPMCPAASTAVTYKLAIVSGAGNGEVAVQLYAKGK